MKALREADSTRGLYKDIYQDALPDDLDIGGQNVPLEVQAAVVNEVRQMAADVGAAPADVMTLRSVAAELTTPPTAQQLADWSDQTVDLLNSTFAGTAAMALADARKLVARDPRLVRILDSNGIGSHPKVVLTLARLARAQRLEGKLK